MSPQFGCMLLSCQINHVRFILFLSKPILPFWQYLSVCFVHINHCWDKSHGLLARSLMWKHIKLSDVSLGTRPRHCLVADEDVKKPKKETSKQAYVFVWFCLQVMSEHDHDALTRITALLEFLNDRQVDLEGLAEQKRVRLQQCVHLRNFEIEARQVRQRQLLFFYFCSLHLFKFLLLFRQK